MCPILSEVMQSFKESTQRKYILTNNLSGPPRLLRPPRPEPCLNFGLHLTLSQPGGQIMPTTVLWALSASNSPWRPLVVYNHHYVFTVKPVQ